MEQNFKEYFKQELDAYTSGGMDRSYELLASPGEKLEPLELLQTIENIEADIISLKQMQFGKFEIDLPGFVKRQNVNSLNEYSSRLAHCTDPFEQKKSVLESKRQEKINVAKAQLDRMILERKLKIEESVSNHTLLMRRKEEVEELLKLYELDFDAYCSSVEDMEIEEIDNNSKTALYALNKVTRSPDILHSALNLVYYPLIAEMDTHEQSFILKVSWTISFILLCYVGRPYFLSIVAMLYFICCISNLLDTENKKRILQMAYSFMVDINVDEYVEDDPDIMDAMLQLEEAEDTNLDEEFKKIDDECTKVIEEVESTNPEKLVNSKVTEAINFVQSEEFADEIEASEKRIEGSRAKIIDANEVYLETLKAERDRIRDNLQMLGTNIPMQEYLKPEIKIGCLYDSDNKPFMESSVNIGAVNTLFTYKDEESRIEVIRYMKLLLSNYLCNIREKRLTVSIYDSEYLGKDFVEFHSDREMKDYVAVHQKDLKKRLEDISGELLKRTKKLRKMSIYDYNKEAQSIGKLTMDYELVIVLATDFELMSDQAFRKFLKYSDEAGIIFWVLSKDASLEPKEELRNNILEIKNSICNVTGYGVYNDSDGDNMAQLPDGFIPYEYDETLGHTVVETFLGCVKDKDRNSSALLYEDGYRKKYIPDNKIWTYSTLKGIDLRFGLIEGDPEQPAVYTLNDANVHMLMGGQTGAGKSATLNEILANMLYMYSPEQLELVMVDFKNIEFKMYTDEYAIPHTSIIAGTKDGEYATSIFQYLSDEIDRRITLMGKKKFNHVMLWNKYCMDNNLMDQYMPRIAVIIDEFQTMFNKVDQKALEKITALIGDVARLARFAGIHLIFTSQSMKGTLSADLLANFSLRAALRCTSDVSTQIIGNDASSKIKERFGWITINDSTGEDPDANRLFRIPFISEEEIHAYIPKLRELCKKGNHIDRKAKFYNEDDIYFKEDLDKWYVDYPNMFLGEGEAKDTFILGERTAYSTNKLPANFRVTQTYSDNILFNAFEVKEQCKFVDLMINQLKAKGIAYIINCSDPELTNVMGLEDKLYSQSLKGWLSDGLNAETIVTSIVGAVEDRKANQELCKEPFYFIGMGWDTIQGLGRSENTILTEKLKQAMYEGPKYNCHFVTVISSMKDMRYWRQYYKRYICAYHSDNESTYTLDTGKASKIPEGFAIYKYGQIEHKFKLYNFDLVSEFSEQEASA